MPRSGSFLSWQTACHLLLPGSWAPLHFFRFHLIFFQFLFSPWLHTNANFNYAYCGTKLKCLRKYFLFLALLSSGMQRHGPVQVGLVRLLLTFFWPFLPPHTADQKSRAIHLHSECAQQVVPGLTWNLFANFVTCVPVRGQVEKLFGSPPKFEWQMDGMGDAPGWEHAGQIHLVSAVNEIFICPTKFPICLACLCEFELTLDPRAEFVAGLMASRNYSI